MKIHFSNHTCEVTDAAASLFSILGTRQGVHIHAPCGGHGTCKKCIVAIHPSVDFTCDASAVATLSVEDRAVFLQNCHIPTDIAAEIVLVYACMIPSIAGIDTVYLPDRDALTGAGVADSATKSTAFLDAGDFSPVVEVKKLTLAMPTISDPIDSETNLRTALATAFYDGFSSFTDKLVPEFLIPHDCMTACSAALREGITALYATVAVGFLPNGAVQRTLVRLTKQHEIPLGLACDIGTTTIAISLWNMENGTLLAENVTENPQRRHGSDVISRMSYASEHGTDTLFREVTDSVRRNTKHLLDLYRSEYCTVASYDSITFVTIAGNSTMQHLFANLSTDSISTVPFYLSTMFGNSIPARDLYAASDEKIPPFSHPNAPIYFAPLSASYVGGDITFGLAYLLTTKPHLSNAHALFLDLGTNGEICCINTRDFVQNSTKKYLFAATAAGPALEGAHIQMGMSATEGAIYDVTADLNAGNFHLKTIHNSNAVGICGSGVISAISACLKTGLITAYGRICDDGEPEDATFEEIYPRFEPLLGEDDEGKSYIRLSDKVSIFDGDIRQVQTAKAAIAAGATVLLKKASVSVEALDALYIAGSFGGGIDVQAAAHIGLLPADAVRNDNIHASGNTSAKGAAMFLFSRLFRDELADVTANSAYIELSSDPGFTDAFVNGMLFGDVE